MGANGNFWLMTLLLLLGDAILVGVVIYFLRRSLVARIQREQKEIADSIIASATEQAKLIEIEARDKALKILQETEAEVNRRRSEIAREEDRLQKRRLELDNRIERLEQREQALNKRQSSLDKRLMRLSACMSNKWQNSNALLR